LAKKYEKMVLSVKTSCVRGSNFIWSALQVVEVIF